MRNECVRVADGGEVLDIVFTDELCFACALGGPDGRTLFMLTAPAPQVEVASRARDGRILITEVEVPLAGHHS